MPPRVSVVLPVRNGGADLRRAIGSILCQTFQDFELVVVNDGSTDETADVLAGITDERIRTIYLDRAGLPQALNCGIALAQGEYIARQDHDDRALPTRLEKQVAFLQANPDCGLVGTRAEIWVGDRQANRFHDHPTDDAVLRFELLFDNPFVHSSVMLRRRALDAVGGYSTDPARQPPEDYELWSRIARVWRIANLPERLTIYREVPGSVSRASSSPFKEKLVLISSENIAAAVGQAAPDRRARDIAALSHGSFETLSEQPDIEAMCRLIYEAGARISSSAPGADLSARIGARVRKLRLQYRFYASGAYRAGAVARFARRMGRLYLNLRNTVGQGL